jgi:hypothetical protein
MNKALFRIITFIVFAVFLLHGQLFLKGKRAKVFVHLLAIQKTECENTNDIYSISEIDTANFVFNIYREDGDTNDIKIFCGACNIHVRNSLKHCYWDNDSQRNQFFDVLMKKDSALIIVFFKDSIPSSIYKTIWQQSPRKYRRLIKWINITSDAIERVNEQKTKEYYFADIIRASVYFTDTDIKAVRYAGTNGVVTAVDLVDKTIRVTVISRVADIPLSSEPIVVYSNGKQLQGRLTKRVLTSQDIVFEVKLKDPSNLSAVAEGDVVIW